MHTTQTAGLALATDLAGESARPRVVALMYVMLLIGMMVSALIVGRLLEPFSPSRLVQIIQSAAAITMILNITALWKQEPRDRAATRAPYAGPPFIEMWRGFVAPARTKRLLGGVALGAAAFSMHDVVLEPYGGQILGLSVGATTILTALWALGMLVGFALSARALGRGFDPHRLAGFGATVGIASFVMVMFAGPVQSPALLASGATLIGFGNGLFSVGTLVAAMALSDEAHTGLALGAWGAVQATAAGAAIALGAVAREVIAHVMIARGDTVLAAQSAGYAGVYIVEVAMLVVLVIILGPLVGRRSVTTTAALTSTLPASFAMEI